MRFLQCLKFCKSTLASALIPLDWTILDIFGDSILALTQRPEQSIWLQELPQPKWENFPEAKLLWSC